MQQMHKDVACSADISEIPRLRTRAAAEGPPTPNTIVPREEDVCARREKPTTRHVEPTEIDLGMLTCFPPRAESRWFPRCAEEVTSPGAEAGPAKAHYNVEFTFDTDARVAITIYYQATEEFQNGVAR